MDTPQQENEKASNTTTKRTAKTNKMRKTEKTSAPEPQAKSTSPLPPPARARQVRPAGSKETSLAEGTLEHLVVFGRAGKHLANTTGNIIRRQRGDDLCEPAVHGGVCFALNVQITAADVMQRLVIRHYSDIRVLKEPFCH